MPEDSTKVIDLNNLKKDNNKTYPYLIVIAGSNYGHMYTVKDEVTIGRGHTNTISLNENGVSRVHCRLYALPGGEVFIEDMNSTNGTYINNEKISRHVLRDGDKIQIGSTTILKFTYDQIEEQFQKHILESAMRDGLTHAYNKRFFMERLQSEFSYAIRHKFPLTLLIFDLDHFKDFNDTHGHLCGDEVLIELTRRMHATIRSEDIFARYGGEEFALIARGINHKQALQMGERLRRVIADNPFIYENLQLQVTTSIGAGCIPYHSDVKSPRDLIEKADAGLYKAKRSGRNRVCII
ncbi:MAG: diguanylate cyclase [Myxococcota bacterium]